MDYENPQQSVITIEGVTLFSNFDSGNMNKAMRVSTNHVMHT